MSAASDITRRAKSNLAFALRVLPRDRRDDAVVFYAFCRTVDDLADAPDLPAAARRDGLMAWRDGLEHGFFAPDVFQREFLALRERLELPTDLLTAIIDGCLDDLEPRHYATWEELDGYVWKVACAVGLISIRIFGCIDPAAATYAEALGRALQLTNILRDVGEDHAAGRVYLPAAELALHGLTARDLPAAAGSDPFLSLMTAVADRAERYFHAAAAALPATDRKALRPAGIMGEIYSTLLGRMRADGFRVFGKRYRLSTMEKLTILSKHLIA